MTKKAERLAEVESAREALREMLPAGSQVLTVLTHVSRSGMSRRIKCIAYDYGHGTPYPPKIRNISHLVAIATGRKWNDEGSIVVGGAGMDMGFHLVYGLSSVLYPDGFECTGDRCPSNDHFNGDQDRQPHHHASGGYALNQEWL